MSDLASLSLTGLNVAIEAEEIVLDMQRREHPDYVDARQAATHKRIDLLWAEKRNRQGSGFGRRSRER